MINIVHGNNPVASREYIFKSISQPIILESKQLTPETLIQVIESGGFFGPSRPILINNLPSEKIFKLLLQNSQAQIFIWYPKNLTACQQKKFSGPKVIFKFFPLPKTVFKFLNTLSLKDFHQTLINEPIELVFYLLHRRISKLLQTRPSSRWLNFHRQLMELDYYVKTGQTPFPLVVHLDLLLASL